MGVAPAVLYREPEPRLSQGDIVADIPHVHLKPPITVLRSKSTNQGQLLQPFSLENPPAGGLRFSQGQPEQVQASCQMARGIILTHDCEIDNDSKHRMVALIRPMAHVPPEGAEVIRNNRNFAMFHLPAYPGGLEESYVDFRRISCIDPRLIEEEKRLASLTPDGLKQFLMKYFMYITRASPESLEAVLGTR